MRDGAVVKTHLANLSLTVFAKWKQTEEFTTISSEIYPQLEEHYQHVFRDWVEEEKEEEVSP